MNYIRLIFLASVSFLVGLLVFGTQISEYLPSKADVTETLGRLNPLQSSTDDVVGYAPSEPVFAGESTSYFVPVVNNSDPQVPKSHEIVILLASDGYTTGKNGHSTFDQCIDNRIAYAKRHNYAFEFVNVSNLDVLPVWAKMPAIRHAMKTYPDSKWVWWLDQDALIMNMNASLQDVLLSPASLQKQLLTNHPFKTSGGELLNHNSPASYSMSDIEDVQLIIAQDHNGLNAGSFFIRNTPLMRMLLDFWEEASFRENKVAPNEQALLCYFVRHHPEIASHVGLVEQRLINAYPQGYNMDWRPGDLVVHLAGCWVENHCEEWWNKFHAIVAKEM
ncbi:alpha-1,2-galactosyltransferase gmh3 [Schizosaccharomyces japonicus yFS275]|uniref:Alpha-1,2-galactosyltransferase gmh3 n=1 Tax=Schizosaccharomyces japonicus (strain yFS275 / FY16936) TaxID=402676 RepID=B6K6R3_SCHJY|nr:alpha-1,2-galactosyltransferase gmh3 [Schizosaccharomyces japonicus yFS275]EEB09217.1 alpha-1,2-galactosyltransferase gmh3 [Schizosaccharomyces japonicus yFS275]